MAGAQVTIVANQIDKQRLGYMGLSVTEYDTANEPQIAAGSKVEIGGALFEFTALESATGWAGIGINNDVYVKLVVAGPTVTAAFTTTAPSWSTSKQGFYDGLDRYVLWLRKDGAGNYTLKRLISKMGDPIHRMRWIYTTGVGVVFTAPFRGLYRGCAIGGGGGGGGHAGGVCGGGGSGALSEQVFEMDKGDTLTLTIGTGGPGGIAGTGSTGVSSSITDGIKTASAMGGKGGEVGPLGPGGAGGDPNSASADSGSAGSPGGPSTGVPVSGYGAGGPGAAQTAGRGTAGVGAAGSPYGGGGAGGFQANGGAGAAGAVIIEADAICW